jgi:hypothetical protein
MGFLPDDTIANLSCIKPTPSTLGIFRPATQVLILEFASQYIRDSPRKKRARLIHHNVVNPSMHKRALYTADYITVDFPAHRSALLFL